MTTQASLSDYGATPENKASFQLQTLRPNSHRFFRSFLHCSRTQKTTTENVALSFQLLANTSSAFREGMGTSTDTFLNAFAHSTSRRGVPKEVISDRGKTLVGAVAK